MRAIDMPITHCAEGRCTNIFYKNNKCLCRLFIKLVREGKTPHDCYYYNPILDYQEKPRNRKSGRGLKKKRKIAQRKDKKNKREPY